jgi:hypothetical protein
MAATFPGHYSEVNGKQVPDEARMRLLTCAVVAVALMTVPASAVADPTSKPPPGTFKPAKKGVEPSHMMTAAANVEDNLPDNLTLNIGEKRSFRAGVKGAMATDTRLVQVRVDDKGIVTMRGLRPGETVVSVFGKAGQAPKVSDFKQQPKTVKVKVRG